MLVYLRDGSAQTILVRERDRRMDRQTDLLTESVGRDQKQMSSVKISWMMLIRQFGLFFCFFSLIIR